MIMYKTVEKAINRINNRVIKELGYGIDDFLYGVAEDYEYDMNGNKATCDYIIRGLENEADNFIRVAKKREEIDMNNNLYPTRYKATKERNTNPRYNGDDKIVKVSGGYTIMSPWEYDEWRKQK